MFGENISPGRSTDSPSVARTRAQTKRTTVPAKHTWLRLFLINRPQLAVCRQRQREIVSAMDRDPFASATLCFLTVSACLSEEAAVLKAAPEPFREDIVRKLASTFHRAPHARATQPTGSQKQGEMVANKSVWFTILCGPKLWIASSGVVWRNRRPGVDQRRAISRSIGQFRFRPSVLRRF